MHETRTSLPSAIMLAAGVGKRLQSWDLPKCLLPMSGQSLIERLVRALCAAGVSDIHVTTGYRSDALRGHFQQRELEAKFIENPQYTRGSLLSLHAQSNVLRSGRPILLLDADVLCAPAILSKLLRSESENVVLVDRTEVDDEAVKLCFASKRIVDFRKRPEHAYDDCGESVGFFKLSPQMAAALADRCDSYVERGVLDIEYEEALRDLMLAHPERFGAEDVTGLPWIEIDFDADLERARRRTLPRIEAAA